MTIFGNFLTVKWEFSEGQTGNKTYLLSKRAPNEVKENMMKQTPVRLVANVKFYKNKHVEICQTSSNILNICEVVIKILCN